MAINGINVLSAAFSCWNGQANDNRCFGFDYIGDLKAKLDRIRFAGNANAITFDDVRETFGNIALPGWKTPAIRNSVLMSSSFLIDSSQHDDVPGIRTPACGRTLQG